MVLDGTPIYRHKKRIPAGEPGAGSDVFLFYHQTEQAWMFSGKLGHEVPLVFAKDPTAESPDMVGETWMSLIPGQGEVPAPNIAIVAGTLNLKAP